CARWSGPDFDYW
nr:immunoglobulin heavy chain junction region [Macaca mulatta]MOV47565.1 immunoglobulin heavy chain junction region [Macaca mulatta]MOV47581.1 immunoglobulin heavy chain junction region [Macaca mulatta]MOV47585.1 immunoglobulin heavy chain junction region [Macaca mulatta]MOV47646.1 immunoglobulin heavy chain junction region [Macaca mulatta]